MNKSIKLSEYISNCFDKNKKILRTILGNMLTGYYIKGSYPSLRNFIIIVKFSGDEIVNLDKLIDTPNFKPEAKVNRISTTIEIKSGDNTYNLTNTNSTGDIIDKLMSDGVKRSIDEIKGHLKSKHKITMYDKAIMAYLEGYNALVKDSKVIFFKKDSAEENKLKGLNEELSSKESCWSGKNILSE